MSKGKYQNLVIITKCSSYAGHWLSYRELKKRKAAVYEEPYKDIANDLFGRGDAYEILKKQRLSTLYDYFIYYEA